MHPNVLQSAQFKGHRYPAFVETVVEAMRSLAAHDTIIRIRVDNTAKSAVAFTAHWLERDKKMKDIARRVYLETKKSDDDKYVVVYMAKAFDENATVIDYDERTFKEIPKDIQRFLRLAELPA